MSTGASNKTMPVTTAYEEGFDRAYGKREGLAPTRRRVFVSRCSACDGVTHEPGTRLWPCERCGKETRGLVDINVAPPVQSAEAKNAPIMVDRFMEGSVSQDGVDIGSRRKRKDYMQATGVTDSSDYGPGYAEKVKKARDEKVTKATHETVARIAWTDPRWKP